MASFNINAFLQTTVKVFPWDLSIPGIVAISACKAAFTFGIERGLPWYTLNFWYPIRRSQAGWPRVSPFLDITRPAKILRMSFLETLGYEQWLLPGETWHVNIPFIFLQVRNKKKAWSIGTYHSEFTVTVCLLLSKKIRPDYPNLWQFYKAYHTVAFWLPN